MPSLAIHQVISVDRTSPTGHATTYEPYCEHIDQKTPFPALLQVRSIVFDEVLSGCQDERSLRVIHWRSSALTYAKLILSFSVEENVGIETLYNYYNYYAC